MDQLTDVAERLAQRAESQGAVGFRIQNHSESFRRILLLPRCPQAVGSALLGGLKSCTSTRMAKRS